MENKQELGIKPKWLHDLQRTLELLECLHRRIRAGNSILEEWIQELESLLTEYIKKK